MGHKKGANNPVFVHSEVSPNTFVPQIRKACTYKVHALHYLAIGTHSSNWRFSECYMQEVKHFL